MASADAGRECVSGHKCDGAASKRASVLAWAAASGVARALAIAAALLAALAAVTVARADGSDTTGGNPGVGGVSLAEIAVSRLTTPAGAFAAALVALLLLLLARTVVGAKAVRSAQVAPSRKTAALREVFLRRRLDMAGRLAQAVRLPTISYDKHKGDTDTPEVAAKRAETRENLLRLHQLLQDFYPGVHRVLERTVVNELSLVYKWEGTQPELQPFALCGHMDVVPTPSADRWTVPPFDGAISEGFVWGRGSIDDKQAVLGLLEAVEHLISTGFKPRRTIYFLFGHDEEIGGPDGAHNIAAYLTEQRIHFSFILDEGLFLTTNVVPGHTAPIAMVCTGEKGSVSLELTVRGPPGHSSRPDKESPIGILAAAASRLEKNPLPSYFGKGIEADFFRACAHGLAFPLRMLMLNSWLFAPLLRRALAAKPTTAVLVRTTTALTVFKSGEKVNAIPGEAKCIVNHRIHPGDSVASVIEYDRRIIADSRVQIRELDSLEPAPVSDTKSAAFKTICACVRGIEPQAVAVPALMVGNTDTKHYWALADNIFRFAPTRMNGEADLKRFHGIDERIDIDNFAESAAFYAGVITEYDDL